MTKKTLANDSQNKSEVFYKELGLYREKPYWENEGHQTITSTLEIKS